MQRSLEQSSQELQAKFEELLESRHVYYDPPASLKMKYDAIVFSRSRIDNWHADNMPYKRSLRYEVTTITKDPDAPIIEKIANLPTCTHDRHFVSDNLHHNTFILYN